MTINRYGEIVKNGFICSNGEFRTAEGGVQRVEASHLRSLLLVPLFAPAMFLDNKYDQRFVRGQLFHYGITFRESDISGSGAGLLQRSLAAGECDKVPDHIVALREEMHAEWLASLSAKEASSYPEFAMEKYFLTAGKPDTSKTETVVGFPLNRFGSGDRADKMRDAASKVPDLYCSTGLGPKTETVFMGWNSEAVQRAAEDHVAREEEEDKKRQEKRERLHNDYLDSLKSKTDPQKYPLVGHYIVDCSDIDKQWPDDAKDMVLNIFGSSKEAVSEGNYFEATYDFGFLEGVMLLGPDLGKLGHCDETESEDEWESGGNEDVEGDDNGFNKNSRATSKRKARSSSSHRQPKKRRRVTKNVLTQWGVLLQNTRYPNISFGEIDFEDKTMSAFQGKIGLPGLGSVPFSARKISELPRGPVETWADFSRKAHKRAI